jgi:membrane protease YdiL (CAAX protease family)
MHPAADFPVSGKRLTVTLACGIAAAALFGGGSWFVQSQLIGVGTPLMLQIIVLQVYGILLGALMLGFRPPSLPPLSLRFTSFAHCALAVPALAAVVAISLAIQAMLVPIAGDVDTMVHRVLAIATDVERIQGQPAHVWAVAIFRGTFIVPLFEEILFRGALLPWLRQKMRPALAVSTSAALFASMHVYPVILPYPFVFGLAAGWLRLATGSTLPGVIMHVLNSLLFLGAGLLLLK